MSYRDVNIANIIKVNIFLISLQTQIAEFQVPLRSQYNPVAGANRSFICLVGKQPVDATGSRNAHLTCIKCMSEPGVSKLRSSVGF